MITKYESVNTKKENINIFTLLHEILNRKTDKIEKIIQIEKFLIKKLFM